MRENTARDVWRSPEQGEKAVNMASRLDQAMRRARKGGEGEGEREHVGSNSINNQTLSWRDTGKGQLVSILGFIVQQPKSRILYTNESNPVKL